ncbi:MAG TPA: hypothetical protein VH637_13000 [Streptosporangiaceae bacterium]
MLEVPSGKCGVPFSGVQESPRPLDVQVVAAAAAAAAAGELNPAAAGMAAPSTPHRR